MKMINLSKQRNNKTSAQSVSCGWLKRADRTHKQWHSMCTQGAHSAHSALITWPQPVPNTVNGFH